MSTELNIDRWIQFESNGFILRGRCWSPPFPQSVGVICCHALGEEKKSSHRSLVCLAGKLAHAGFPTLMFDYVGCGDSDGEDGDGNLARWQHNIDDAIKQLVAICGVEGIVLLGVRLGGWLALQIAAQEQVIHAVILWSPLLDLQEYVRSLGLQQRMIEITLGFARHLLMHSEQGVDLGGILLSRALLEEMRGATLPSRPQLSVLYLEPSSQSHLPAEAENMINRLQLAGCIVETRVINDGPLRAQAFSPVRPILVAETVSWIGEHYAASGQI